MNVLSGMLIFMVVTSGFSGPQQNFDAYSTQTGYPYISGNFLMDDQSPVPRADELGALSEQQSEADADILKIPQADLPRNIVQESSRVEYTNFNPPVNVPVVIDEITTPAEKSLIDPVKIVYE
ncbi:MAG: hypothetical protein A3F17_03095 [Gammaproteobacteria bacterium RIFCSPHIGHO2_12_FULL_41_15]|nr:MAG: hypothetical protein A3F17_03095 [Gammaproteobacteria bacterium RIFCSPHIGHO2_12_FULL_41_15]